MAIQSTGIGSGLDVSGIVSKLMSIESQPLLSIQKKQTSYQADLTALGALSGSVSSFQSSLVALSSSSTFKTLAATASDSTIASVTASSTASAGSYNVNVTQLAQSQTISSAGQLNTTSAIGSGTSTTLSFQFGTISGGTLASGAYTGATFTQDATQSTGTVTIDSTNNSLQGIRDAINNAKIGINASIVGDGSATPYHLVLNSSATGANSSIKIDVAGDAALQSLLSNDPAGTQNFKEVTTGQNANMTINGIAITSPSNKVGTAIQGVTVTAQKIGTTSVSVTTNTASVQNSINSFVSAYNSLNSTISQLTSYNPTTKVAGALLGDPTTQAIQNQVRNTLSTAVNGLGGGLTSLAQIGVTFQKDGSLAVDSSKLQTALSNNFSDVGGLFAAIGKTTDSLTSLSGSTSATQPGNYALNVTQIATQGVLTGDVNLNTSSTTIAAGTKIDVKIDGLTGTVNLAAGNYTASQLSAMIQSSINGTSSFSNLGVSVTASIDTNGFLKITSGSYGSASTVSLTNNTGTTVSSLTGSVTSGTTGKNVSGTLNGVVATGLGQILTGATGSPSEGLQVVVNGGATGARGTVNFSQGYAYKLNNLASSFLGTTGLISSATKGINSTLTTLQKQTTDLNARLALTQARLQAQYSSLDTIISNLNATQSFLTSQIGVLNGSTNK
ncbi:flagellar filament capping protein FliD [Undibacterium sp. SXout7W]|uniref:flagellar filament capping protein FliD n=1 Tax=Undibacterium sp. SXout7W TaxID=3413049 RepID=UPI003BF3AACA